MGILQKLRKWRKPILIIEIVVIYLFTLCIILVKHSRDKVDTSQYDNILFSGENYQSGVSVSDGSIVYLTQDKGREYSEMIQLDGVYSLNISFDYSYPENTRDTSLYVDLFNSDAGFDEDSQQFEVVMRSGTEYVDNSIVIEAVHPDKAYIRFVSLEPDVEFTLENVRVCAVSNSHLRIVKFLWLVDAGLVFVAVVSVIMLYCFRKKEDEL